MNTAPTENVQLTFEQLQQIDVFQKRLSNLQTEVSIASKLLKETKGECEMVTKEKAYQEELLAATSAKASESKTELSNLEEKVRNSIEILAANAENAAKAGIENEAKAVQLEEREALLEASEKSHIAEQDAFLVKVKNLEEEKKIIEEAKEAFSEAIKKVIWK